MTTSKRIDDTSLWVEYHAAREAGDEASMTRLAGEIVGLHLGFLRMYAEKNAFPQWGREEREVFMQELVAFALEKVPKYDTSITGKNGKKAQFVTFLRHSFQGVRWKVQADRFLIKQSVETKRLRAAMEQWHDEVKVLRGTVPSDEETAEYLTVLMGKQKHPIGVAQVKRLRDQPFIIHADDRSHSHANFESDSSKPSNWDEIDVGVPSPETLVVAAEEERELSERVAAALRAANLTPLEKVIVSERLMAPARSVIDGDVVSPGPVSHRELAARFGLDSATVRATESSLVVRLRDLLS